MCSLLEELLGHRFVGDRDGRRDLFLADARMLQVARDVDLELLTLGDGTTLFNHGIPQSVVPHFP